MPICYHINLSNAVEWERHHGFVVLSRRKRSVKRYVPVAISVSMRRVQEKITKLSPEDAALHILLLRVNQMQVYRH
jgi:hypothetical protein